MTINRNNFEAYLLDYLEGNLDPLLTADLMVFLTENPEFEKYLPDNESYALPADIRIFEYKQLLKKDFQHVPAVTSDNFDEFCIAACEGLLGKDDLNRLNAFVALNPDKRKDLDIYRNLRLQPDLSIKFTGKPALKKTGSLFKLRYLYYGIGIAASIALIVFLFTGRSGNEIRIELPVATIDNSLSGKPTGSESTGKASPFPPSLPAAKSNNALRIDKNHHAEPVTHVEPALADREKVLLEKIEPLQNTSIQSKQYVIALQLPETQPGDNLPAEEDRNRKSPDVNNDSFLGALLARVDFWKTAETALDGFNYLTESNLSISKTLDEKGNLSGLQVNTERFSVKGIK